MKKPFLSLLGVSFLSFGVSGPLGAQGPSSPPLPSNGLRGPTSEQLANSTPTPPMADPTPTPTVSRATPAAALPTSTPVAGIVIPLPTATATPAAMDPTETPSNPVTPSPQAAQAQDQAISHLRRLIRDVRSNTDNVKAIGNFGAQLYLVADEGFFQNWRKPEAPTIAPVQLAVRGQPLYTVVIFYGSARDNAGLSNVSYDLTVRRPDGTVYAERKAFVGLQGLAPDERELSLGRNYLAINIQPNDPAGIYTVEAVVRDNVGRAELPLKQTFVVR